MSYRKFNLIILASALTFVLLLVLTNLVIDPFYIFRTPFFKIQYQVNDRYAKISFLKRHWGQYNGLIMGSSRMFFTEPAMLDRYIPGARFYNFSTLGATTYEHMLHIKYLLSNGYPLKHLYIGLDVEAALDLKAHNDSDSLVMLHPDISGKNPITFYWSFLTILPEKDIKQKLRKNFYNDNPRDYAIEIDGALHSKKTVEGSANLPQHLFALPDKLGVGKVKNSPAMEDSLKALQDIVDLCRQYNVNLTIFASPFHISAVPTFVSDNYYVFLKRLASITSFWDFGGYNSVTANNMDYMDPSHYTPAVSRLIAARIFGDKSTPVPRDFGVLATRENIDNHLKELKAQFEKQTSPTR